LSKIAENCDHNIDPFLQAIKAGKKTPPTPPSYSDERIIVRKTPLPTVNLSYLL
jgi:hypothetical protein